VKKLGILLLALQACFANASPDPINRIALLNDGDRAYEQRVDEAQARHALETYRKLHEENPDDVEASWRLSMACYFVGLRLTQDNGKKATLFAEGRDAGRAAIEKKTGCAPCYFWSAINMALYGQSVGVLKMLFTLGTVRDYLRKSIELDPTYASAGAYLGSHRGKTSRDSRRRQRSCARRLQKSHRARSR
jgi:hypothetical protein